MRIWRQSGGRVWREGVGFPVRSSYWDHKRHGRKRSFWWEIFPLWDDFPPWDDWMQTKTLSKGRSLDFEREFENVTDVLSGMLSLQCFSRLLRETNPQKMTLKERFSLQLQ